MFYSDDDISIKRSKIRNIGSYISLSSFLRHQTDKSSYEILVSKPHLTRDFFVKCYKDIPYEKNIRRLKIGRPLKLNHNWSPDKQKWISPNYSRIKKPSRNEIARELLRKKMMKVKKEPNNNKHNNNEPNYKVEPINFSNLEEVN